MPLGSPLSASIKDLVYACSGAQCSDARPGREACDSLPGVRRTTLDHVALQVHGRQLGLYVQGSIECIKAG